MESSSHCLLEWSPRSDLTQQSGGSNLLYLQVKSLNYHRLENDVVMWSKSSPPSHCKIPPLPLAARFFFIHFQVAGTLWLRDLQPSRETSSLFSATSQRLCYDWNNEPLLLLRQMALYDNLALCNYFRFLRISSNETSMVLCLCSLLTRSNVGSVSLAHLTAYREKKNLNQRTWRP